MLIIIESGWWAYRLFPILDFPKCLKFFIIKVQLKKKERKTTGPHGSEECGFHLIVDEGY